VTWKPAEWLFPGGRWHTATEHPITDCPRCRVGCGTSTHLAPITPTSPGKPFRPAVPALR